MPKPSDFEKAVLMGVSRAFWDQRIGALVREGGHGPAAAKRHWTDPGPRWKALRREIAEYIARDLLGLEDYTRQESVRFPDPATGKLVTYTVPPLAEQFRREWNAYREECAGVSPEEIIEALPFSWLREKRATGHRTDIERLVERVLQDGHEHYEFEAQVDFYSVDFLLPDRDIMIECDSEYWHGSKEQRAKDISKSAYLESKGWEVYRLRFGASDVEYDVAEQWVDEILQSRESRRRHRATSYLLELESQVQELAGRSNANLEAVDALQPGDAGLEPIGYASRQEFASVVRKHALSFKSTLGSVQSLFKKPGDRDQQFLALFGKERGYRSLRGVPTATLIVDSLHLCYVTPGDLEMVVANATRVSGKLLRLFESHQGHRGPRGLRRKHQVLTGAYCTCLTAWLAPLGQMRFERTTTGGTVHLAFAPYADDMHRGQALLSDALKSFPQASRSRW